MLMSSSLSRADARSWQPLEVTTNPIISPPWCPGSLGRCDRDGDRQCPTTYPSQLPPQIPSVVTLTHQRSANSVRWDSGTHTGLPRSTPVTRNGATGTEGESESAPEAPKKKIFSKSHRKRVSRKVMVLIHSSSVLLSHSLGS